MSVFYAVGCYGSTCVDTSVREADLQTTCAPGSSSSMERPRCREVCRWMQAAALLLSAVLGLVHADFQVEMGAVRIVYPQNAKGRMDMAIANFGAVKYGATLVGNVIYPSPGTLYGPNYDCGTTACNYGCSFFNESRPALKVDRRPGTHTIMLLDRGPHDPSLKRPCYFLDKAYHAQLAGADALLVINDEPGDLSTAVAPKDEDSERELAELTISAGLISQEAGKQIKELMKVGPVTLALNWTDALPKRSQVTWEFWTNSNDECGPLCDKQKKFVRDFKGIAKQLEVGAMVQFTPHYLIWVCQFSSDAEECKTQCIRQGAYCCPDPDDNIYEGYSGRDVLLMNVRSLCFGRVARKNDVGWLWWEYVDTLGQDCPMKDKKYTPSCSDDVWRKVVSGTKMDTSAAKSEWVKCYDLGDLDSSEAIPLLDQELADQTGNNTASTIAILPTIRVNRQQYRGSLEAGSVLRGICAGFPEGVEPGMCNEGWVSDNECAVGGEGWQACNSWLNTTKGLTQCVETFSGWKCDCGPGFIKTTDNSTGTESCEEINECLMTSGPWMNERCKCDRCVCENTIGSYKCSGALPDYCTPEHNYAGCWRGTFNGQFYHACKDELLTYRELSEYGVRNETDKLWSCSCPPCFKATSSGGCEPACDLAYCDAANGCGSSRRGRGGGGSHGGVGGFGVFMIVVVTMGVTAGGMYAAYQVVVKRRMQEDMRNILEEYVPLASAPTTNEGPRMFTMAASPVPPRITPSQ